MNGLISAEQRLSYLDVLPDDLFDAVVGHPVGRLEHRVTVVDLLRRALLAGVLPDPQHLDWPTPGTGKLIHAVLHDLGIARFCRDQEELTHRLILDLLEALRDLDLLSQDILARLLALLRSLMSMASDEPLECARELRERGFWDGEPDSIDPSADGSDHDEVFAEISGKLPVQAMEQATGEKLQELNAEWQERVQIYRRVAEIFGDLGQAVGLGWDLTSGVLHHHGWFEIARLAKLLEKATELKDIVRALGRMQERDDEEETVLETITKPMGRAQDEWRDILDPRVPAETRGVTLSDDVSRMLPAEAALLGHPTLKLLWHARRAEHRLTTYLVEGVSTERVSVDVAEPVEHEAEVTRRRLDRGPIILCIDSSGSMEGWPEAVAKAVALQAARLAHAEERRCLLYLFSGRRNVADHELALTPDGIAGLLEFLSMSFGGGTEVSEVLKRACSDLAEDKWTRADVLVVSDGLFNVPDETRLIVDEARKAHSLRVHGLLVGEHDPTALNEICDELHCFTDWKSLARHDEEESD